MTEVSLHPSKGCQLAVRELRISANRVNCHRRRRSPGPFSAPRSGHGVLAIVVSAWPAGPGGPAKLCVGFACHRNAQSLPRTRQPTYQPTNQPTYLPTYLP
jgi:hypothetical protein